MRVSSALPVLAATHTLAFIVIPHDLSDGLYDVYTTDGVNGQPGTQHTFNRIDEDSIDADRAPPQAAVGGGKHPHHRHRLQPHQKRDFFSKMFSGDPCQDEGCRAIPVGPQLTETVPLPPKSKIFCRTEKQQHEWLTPARVREAASRLFYTPLYWVPPEQARFALHNDTVVYMCNMDLYSWKSASLLEFWDAMATLDETCNDRPDEHGDSYGDYDDDDFNVRPAKLAVKGQDKFYGREPRSAVICQYEHDVGGVLSELRWKEKHRKCDSYVSGIYRAMGKNGACNKYASGPTFWNRLKRLVPWYTDSIFAQKGK